MFAIDPDVRLRRLIKEGYINQGSQHRLPRLFAMIVEEFDKTYTEDNQNTRDAALVECFWKGATLARGGEV